MYVVMSTHVETSYELKRYTQINEVQSKVKHDDRAQRLAFLLSSRIPIIVSLTQIGNVLDLGARVSMLWSGVFLLITKIFKHVV